MFLLRTHIKAIHVHGWKSEKYGYAKRRGQNPSAILAYRDNDASWLEIMPSSIFLSRNRYTCCWINKAWTYFPIISSSPTLPLPLAYRFSVVTWDNSPEFWFFGGAFWLFSSLLYCWCHRHRFGRRRRELVSSSWRPEVCRGLRMQTSESKLPAPSLDDWPQASHSTLQGLDLPS